MLLKKDPISTNKVQMRLQISDLNKALPPKKKQNQAFNRQLQTKP